jgi:tripartite-type tricarboxylate transporter receptor subunit TctC
VTSAQRSRALPSVAAVAGQGLAVVTWLGLIAPSSTPRDIVNQRADAWKTGAATQSALTAFESIGADIQVNRPQQFAAFIRAENMRWGSLIQKRGIQLDGQFPKTQGNHHAICTDLHDRRPHRRPEESRD